MADTERSKNFQLQMPTSEKDELQKPQEFDDLEKAKAMHKTT